MARHKKNIAVDTLKADINTRLANPKLSQEEKRGLCTLLEHVLMETNNYQGFNYLTWLNGGFDAWRQAGEPDFPEKNQYLEPEYDRRYY